MKIFIVGITGGVGRLLARELIRRGDSVRGLVRRADQADELRAAGIGATVGDLTELSPAELTVAFGESQAVVFAAGSNGGPNEATKAVDGDGVLRVLEAAVLANGARFVLVSVLPESWRERNLGDELEYYFSIKKQTDVAVSRSSLDWVIVRPSLLLDTAGTGKVALGAAELHDEISREDVAKTVAEVIHEPRLSRQILELNKGETPIDRAVAIVAEQREPILLAARPPVSRPTGSEG